MRAFLTSIGCVVGMMVAAAGPVMAEAKVEEKVVGPAKQGTNFNYTVSPRGLHLASVANSGSRFVVIVDGVEGPKFDEIFASAPTFQHLPDTHGELTQHAIQGAFPVAFSPDGTRYAYAARLDKDVVIICDGKELFRAPYSVSRPGVNMLQFSPDGKHVYFQTMTTDTMYSSALVMDGKQGPAVADVVWPVFSNDGEHWAYYGKRPTPEQQGFVVVDGKEVDWVAGRLRYTPDGKLVGVHTVDHQKAQLLVDGKPMLESNQIDRLVIAPNGDIGATGLTNNLQTRQLYVNGKPVPGTEGAFQPIVSPDGKRWAVHCTGSNPPGAWVVVDGKKGPNYGGVSNIVFTGDSSKVIHVAEVQRQKFVIVDDQEFGPSNYILIPPSVGSAGSHYAFVWNDPMARKPVVNGKEFPAFRGIEGFSFSPDGARYAFLAAPEVLGNSVLIVDGEQKEGIVPRGMPMMFSPDSKRYAAVCQLPKERNASILIDDQPIPCPDGTGNQRLIGFTPDSKHLAIAASQDQKDRTVTTNIYLDGKLVAQLDGMNLGGLRQGLAEIGPDGTIIALGTSKGTEVKRFVITPSDDTSIETWIADVKEAKDKAVAAATQKAADEQAAKAKAAADQQAAKEQAAADKKAAIEAKAAAKKAAQEKAAADKAAKKAGKAPPQ